LFCILITHANDILLTVYKLPKLLIFHFVVRPNNTISFINGLIVLMLVRCGHEPPKETGTRIIFFIYATVVLSWKNFDELS